MAKYKNVSDQSWILGNLNKIIRPDSKTLYEFSESDIEKDSMLAHLVETGKLVLDVKDVENVEVVKQQVTEKQNIAIPINEAYTQITVLGNSESTVSYNPNEILSIGAPRDFTMVNVAREIENKKAGVVKIASSKQKESGGVVEFTTPTTNFTVKKKKSNNLEAWICSPANDASGYGKFGREMIYGLQKREVDVQLDLFRIPDFRSAVPLTEGLKNSLETQVSADAPAIWAIMPPKYLNRPGRKILFTMMETYGIPESFMEKCNYADEIWTPSSENLRMFEEGGCKAKVHHIPLGVDTELYKPMKLTEEQKSILNVKTKGFVFLSLFGWSLRKGYDALLRSYLQAFSDQDDVTLLIVSRKDGMSTDEKNKEIIDKIKEYVKLYKPNGYPHIVHIGKPLQEETLPIIYNMSDCFVLPSRGEASGMPYMESGSCEKPVIATRCGGQMDYLTDENSYLIDIEGYSLANQELKCVSSYYGDKPFAVLGEKTVSQMKEVMRSVYEDDREARKKAKILRNDLVENFTWEHMNDKIHKRLKEINKD